MDYQVFQNYHQDCEADVNKQINQELNSSCVYLSIKAEQDKWSNALAAMWRDLHMEKDVNQCLLDLHKLATHNADPYLRDFLQNHYLDEKLKMIKKLEDQITNLKRLGAAGNGLGEYLFDRFSMD